MITPRRKKRVRTPGWNTRHNLSWIKARNIFIAMVGSKQIATEIILFWATSQANPPKTPYQSRSGYSKSANLWSNQVLWNIPKNSRTVPPSCLRLHIIKLPWKPAITTSKAMQVPDIASSTRLLSRWWTIIRTWILCRPKMKEKTGLKFLSSPMNSTQSSNLTSIVHTQASAQVTIKWTARAATATSQTRSPVWTWPLARVA